MTAAPALTYRSDIDGLRAVAILLVAVFHFRLLPMGGAGFIGVDVFFVISGFLITRILSQGFGTGDFILGGFYLARVRRLAPALAVTLALYLAAGWMLFLPDRMAELSREALLTQLYVVNVYFWRTISYFGMHADAVPLLHMWSLAVEEQFYIFYPLFLALVFRFARRLVLPVLTLGALASFALGWWATGWKPEASFYLLPTRAWELLAGGILALAMPHGARPGPVAGAAGLAGLALIGAALAIHTPVTPFPGWFAALPVLGAVLLILAGPQTPSGRVLSTAPMVWIGRISYPLYLVHWPVIILAQEMLHEVTLPWRAGGFLVSVALAWAIWRFVEAPVRTRRVLAGSRAFLAAAATAMGVLAAASLSGVLTGGMPGRFSPEVRALLAYAGDKPWPFFDCEMTEKNRDRRPCVLGAPDAPVSVAVIGDSHGQAMAGALDLWLKGAGRGGALWFHHGCMPLLDTGGARCKAFVETAFAAVEADPAMTTVLLHSAWRHDPKIYGGRYLEGAAADAGFQAALGATIDRLRGAGKEVILLEPTFYAVNSVPETLAQNLQSGDDRPIDQPLAAHRDSYALLYPLFAHAAETPGVRSVSLIDGLCAGGTCRAVLDGVPLFSDTDHIRFGASQYFADLLAAALPFR